MAIDMSKVKGESSTEFGKSLLAETQASNARINKANDKANQRSALIKVGLGAADMFVAKQADAFYMNTENTKKIIQTKLAWQNSQEIAATEATAQAYAGGYDAYWSAQGVASAEEELKKKYGTTGNVLQRETLASQRGAIFGNFNKQNHLKRLEANKTYLASGGGEGAYLKALKLQTPRTVMGKIANYIGDKSGLTADAEIAQNAESILTSAQALNTFQETYKTSKNAAIAIAVAKEVDALPEKLRPVATTFSEPLTEEFTSLLGHTIKNTYFIATSTDIDGNKTRIVVDPAGQPISLRSKQNKNNFSSTVSQAIGVESIVSLGSSVAAQYLTIDEKEILNKSLAEEMENFGNLDRKAEAKALEAATARIHSRIGVMAYQAENTLKLTSVQAAKLSIEMMRLDMTANGTGAAAEGIGKFNPYNTLVAMSNMENREPGQWAYVDSVSKVVGVNGENLLASYLNSTSTQREQMDTAVAGIKLDEDTTKDLVNFHRIAQKIFKLPRDTYGSFKEAVEIVTRPEDELAVVNNTLANTSNPDPATTKISAVSIATLPIPPKAPDSLTARRLDGAGKEQRRKYSAIIQAHKDVKYAKGLAANLKIPANAPRYEKAVLTATQTLNDLHEAYMSTYGE